MLKPKPTPAFILAVAFVVLVPLLASQEATPSEREAMYYRYLEFASYVKGGSVEPHWMADGSSFWYAEGAPDNTVIWEVDPHKNTKEPLFNTARLRQALTNVLGHEPPYHGLPFDNFAFIEGEKAVKFGVEDTEFILQLDTYKVSRAPALSEEEKSRLIPQVTRRDPYGYWPDVYEVLSPDGGWFAGIRDYNLWLRSTSDGRRVQITTDGVQDYEWNEGYPRFQPNWSPDSRKLAVNKIDFRGAPKIPVVHYIKQKQDVDWVYYPKAGEPRAHSTLYIVDVLSKQQVKVDAAEEPGPRPLLWRPDSSELLFLKVARYGLKLELMAADPNTGSTRVVLSESDPVGVSFPLRQPQSMISLLSDGRRFIWTSERDGWNHLYLYHLDGSLIRRLTQGTFPVVRVVAVDESAGWVYFTAQSDLQRPYDTHLCRVNLEGQGFQQLTDAPGQHEIRFAPSKEFFLDMHSTVARPPIVELRRADGILLQTLSKADTDALVNELKWRPPEEFVVTAADGKTDLWGVLYKPYDFDPGRRYPVIQALAGSYGHTGMPRTFGDVSGQSLAQLGFVVIRLAPRGTDGRGKRFRDVAYGQPGQHETADLVAALRQLAADRPYMDLARVGLFGVSYTGFMVLRALLLAPDVYHVGVAVAPITDMADHWRNEAILGPPAENEKAYADASNPALAANLKGKLLLIHGTSDKDVPISHTMKMVEALIQAGKPYDLLILPEQPHEPRGISWTYMREAVRRYFQEHLKP
ncbi:MAG: DPP IV N-terminal domain-containing protein [Acidobacteria bacterium]|nr:DPP IV N-terminal domain-containing protein [Acidobacteriota bacterium]